MLFVLSGSSIDRKSALVQDNVKELNVVIGNTSLLADMATARTELSSVSTRTDEYSTLLNEPSLARLNIIENILRPGKASRYKELVSNTSEFYRQQSNNATALNTKLEALTKFINYSPQEDFAIYGADAAQDGERISRATSAYQELIDNKNVSGETSASINEALEQLSLINSTADTSQFILATEQAQEVAVASLSSDISTLKSAFSEFYNSLLYQQKACFVPSVSASKNAPCRICCLLPDGSSSSTI